MDGTRDLDRKKQHMSMRSRNARLARLARTGPLHGGEPGQGAGGGGGPVGGQQQQGGQQGAGGGGPPQGQPQGQQQGQPDPFGNLLDGARQQGQQQGTGQQAGQQQQGQQQAGPLTADDVNRIVTSAIDQRINAINNPGGGRRNQQQNQGQGQGQGQQQNQGDGSQQQVASVDRGARREARLAFREYVGDRIRFLSDTERNAAVQIGTAMIATWDGSGDADEFGMQVATKVATTVTDLAEMYKRTTIDALRKQGLLKEQPSGPGAGSVVGGFQLPTTTPAAAAGQLAGLVTGTSTSNGTRDPNAALMGAVAAADQYNQKAGWTKTPATQQGN